MFVFRLQPPIAVPGSCAAGIACATMPANAAALNFSPINFTVVLGVNSTVKWTNQDTVQHTVVVCPVGGGQVCSPAKALASSPVLSRGDAFELTFNATGTYHFFCSIHPATMRGTVVVVSGSTSST